MAGPGIYAGAYAGGKGIEALANWLGGSTQRKRLEEVYNLLMKQSQVDYSSPEIINQQLQQIMTSLAPSLQRSGRTISKRLGVDSGAAQGQLATNLLSTKAGVSSDLLRQGLSMDLENSLRSLQMLLQAAGAS